MSEQSRQAKYMTRRRQRGDAATISVLIPSEMKSQMDDAADASGMTRKDWLTEAISEKLKRQTPKSGKTKAATAITLMLLIAGTGETANCIYARNTTSPAKQNTAVETRNLIPQAENREKIHTIQASDVICQPIKVMKTFARNTPSLNGSQSKTEIIRQTKSIGCGQEKTISETEIPLPN